MTPPSISHSLVAENAPLAVPNVFISYECERTETPTSPDIASIQETYAQCGEDVIVAGLLAARLATAGRGMESLFYVEIGADHPVQTSNTYLFYRRYGAAGVLAVADASSTIGLQRVRPRDVALQTAVSARTEATVEAGAYEVNEAYSPTLDHATSSDTGGRMARSIVPNLHVNDLLIRYANRPIDFLTINVERGALEILEALNFCRFRPFVVQCKPSEHVVPGTSRRMVQLLRERGYVLAAGTPISLIFVDFESSAVSRERPVVNSFDVFDTLISRRCVDPLRVFAMVETATGIPGFAAVRRAAEIAIANPGMTFDDIHAEVSLRLGLDAAASELLKQAEIDAELAQAIPISENLARVKDGDLLLSDMYLSPHVIRSLLQKAGLDRCVGLVVSTDGKQSGRIWPQVQASLDISRHLGDNRHSDVEMPRRFGIVSEHTRVAEPTPVEQWCLDAGLRPLGELIRAARLRIATTDPLARQLLMVQTQFNFPILMLTSIALHRHAKSIGATRLLFSSRDCHLWHMLYSALFPNDLETEYLYTSRRLRVQSTAPYRIYARSRLGDNSILIDLCGSGWSSARLMETLEMPARALYFLHQLPPIPLYEQQHRTSDICRVDALLGPEVQGLDHIRLEMCNYALHGSAVGMRDILGVAVPVFDGDCRSAEERRLIAQQVDCLRAMIADAGARLPDSSVTLSSMDIAEVVKRLYALLSRETCLHTAFSLSHHREDLFTLDALRLLPG